MKKSRPLTLYILFAMILGIIVGYACNKAFPDKQAAATVSGYISLVTDLFLRLIKMIIAPLVFSTLVVGIAHMGDSKTVGRIGAKTMGWFITASLMSLTLGLIMVTILRPGENIGLPLPDVTASSNLKTASFSIKEFVTHLVPTSIFAALAGNEMLQIVVFAIFFGLGAAALGELTKPMILLIDQVALVMLKVTGNVMKMAPLAVFAAMASTITTQGIGILVTYAKFMGGFYLSLILLWGLLILAGYIFLGPRTSRLVSLIREPFLLAFSTASSEAAYPKLLSQLERFGVSSRITSFVLPMGYSFNLDGSMMYCTFAIALHRAGLWYSSSLRDADRDAPFINGHFERHGGRTARFPGRDRCHADNFQYSGSRVAFDYGCRPIPRYGSLGDECRREFNCRRRGGQVGRRTLS